MLLLFTTELLSFLTSDLTTTVSLDTVDASTVRINFNVTFLSLHCDYLSVDVLDSLGTNRQNITKNVEKWQLDSDGKKRIFSGRNKDVREVRSEDHDMSLEEMHENGVHAVDVTKDTWDQFINERDNAFVDFYAPWCIWCQRLHPTWEQFAEKVEEEKMPISVGKVDCVAESSLCSSAKIQAFPTLRWYHKSSAIMPDYKSDRTVNALNSYASRKLEADEKYKDWERKAKASGEKGKNGGGPQAPTRDRPDHPACQVSGYLLVNRVPGNFHIEAESVNHNLNAAMTNLSHVVNHLSFGEPEMRMSRKDKKKLKKFPSEYKNFSPIDSTPWINPKPHRAHHHYMKIVSTHFDSTLVKYQILENSQEVSYDEEEVPEARFSYDISPMAVTVERKGRKSWYEFLTSLFAIVGGTFTTLGLIDGILYKAFKSKKL
eukprot:CAMPEP_0182516562 /NCGR_PEP_ID=MMETSP1321-20130603/40561_1 /TAXON_ID=91990 /ORGANISM="Bolidomonas sp., Strain RCC1657" /LENGTH=430 /DNA_ID=CAMNT_0024724167 /DNA_START=38 /DNA_END=1330 /DNA_ORIENTATION=+